MKVYDNNGNALTDDQLLEAAHRMQQDGGGFACAIAQAFLRADSSNRMRLLTAFGDLFGRYGTVDPSSYWLSAAADDIMRRVNGPLYTLGWDVVAETMSIEEVEAVVREHGTLEGAWQALAHEYGLPAEVTGAYAVRSRDVDGLSVTQYDTLEEAAEHFAELVGWRDRQHLMAIMADRYEVSETSDYGTRATLINLSAHPMA